ncbi:dehydration-responsive element-binding protein 1E-like [Momordica charantia]|uniref:Dehydration-responsive element-binding protein 1E-like n=1 Tax=Momordica charantia TaxID=3673 RepID=A0A6J1E0E0_MOMCH|nr:dehydration-responsive element-binding protein 1E-like [Momordica charantia]
MDMFFGQFSDPLPYGDKSESSTWSDAGTPVTHPAAHSDEEVILAASRPKRRAGRRVFKETRHPVYRGVRRRNNDKWVCELREPNKKSRIWLGTYPTAEMAARAHDVAALALRGKSACLNFADSAWRFPIPESTDPSVIRDAAARAANECKDEEDDAVLEGGEGELPARWEPAPPAYVDDEALSNMPMLLASMAEGLLLSPPSFCMHDDVEWGDVDMSDDMSLWSF